MPLQSETRELIQRLGLKEHPEGGWYKETYRSPFEAPTTRGKRRCATLIYYLLPAGIRSRVHRVAWDETWIFQAGGILHLNSYVGESVLVEKLGLATDTQPQIVIPAGTWFNADVIAGDYVLAACMVAPGFEFEDLEMQ
ncbi:MAG: cupin domain-containing protein [Spirochaetes bacterium]|nr:cupin domain-containing protein [Spirochaetota bacterium]